VKAQAHNPPPSAPEPRPGTRTLTEGLVTLLGRPVPAATLERAALHVLDWIGCATLGAREPAGTVLAEFARRSGAGPCHALGVGGLPAAAAILANGGLGNLLEMDDIHRAAILHPGPVIVPAALAAAQELGAPAPSFLAAVVRGYEATIRLGCSVGPGHYRRWHNTATCGPLGAAAAVASLRGLAPERTADALGNALTQAAGPWQCRHEHVMTKQLHTAHAAHAGWLAAQLAALGFTGPRAMLEGPQGFYAAMCPDPDPEALLTGPEEPWKVYETSFKPWPACRHAHAAIDAALALRDAVPPARIVRATVRTYGDAIVFCDRPVPTTPLEARFSLQHAVAVTLLDGAPQLAAFEPAALERADLAALRRKVSVGAGEPYTSAYPRHYGAELTLALDDGTERRFDCPDALGDPENPISPEQVQAKARALMSAAGVAPARIAAIVERTLALPRAVDLSALAAVLP
jgi:2-methylcitrate dehydratase PrpD